MQDGKEAARVGGVKSLPKINLKDHRRGFGGVTAVKEVGDVDNVLRDAPPGEETGWVGINKRVNFHLKTRGENFSNSLHDTILERYGPEVRGVVCKVTFGEENQISAIDPG
jgi:hypothetical protein